MMQIDPFRAITCFWAIVVRACRLQSSFAAHHAKIDEIAAILLFHQLVFHEADFLGNSWAKW
jgi:hypothetical protein